MSSMARAERRCRLNPHPCAGIRPPRRSDDDRATDPRSPARAARRARRAPRGGVAGSAPRPAAARMAKLRNENVGETVGYRIRFESKVSAQTRIEVLTEGILTRRLQTDPELKNVGLVIFDEFHERHLHADLALALCLDSQRALREDLKILVMSATLDGAAVSKLLDDAPMVASSGRSFPVDIRYLPRDPEDRLPQG